jgi:transketolase
MKYTFTEKKDIQGFGDGLTELGRTNPNVAFMCRFNWFFKNGSIL